MILYADTSALVPLIVQEPSTSSCGELWDAADRVVAARIAYVEAIAALAMAERLQRVSTRQARRAAAAFEDLWTEIDVVELGPELMASAGRLARDHALRAYGATHCAAAVLLSNEPEMVAASGDARLLAAWRAEGLATRDTNRR